tara:strand:- start:58 stop:372 length:315 start_codon:yes stop_codon:yes gene_type:complete
MKAKEVAKILAGRVNQEHYILQYMEKLYLLGVEDGKKMDKTQLSNIDKNKNSMPHGSELFCSGCKSYTTYENAKSGTIKLTEDYTKDVSICPNCLQHSVLSDCT